VASFIVADEDVLLVSEGKEKAVPFFMSPVHYSQARDPSDPSLCRILNRPEFFYSVTWCTAGSMLFNL
jgi:hypothetical protein